MPMRISLPAGLLVLCCTASASAQALSAEQAVERAARNNASLKAAMHDAAAAGHAYDAADRILVPSYFLNVEGQYTERISTSARGATRVGGQGVTSATGVRATSPVGTTVEVGVEAGINWQTALITPATNDTTTFGPNYTGQVYATARQPLLQGAGGDAVLAPVRQAEDQRTAAERQRDQAASQVVSDVLSAYWELWYAQQAVEVQEHALELAQRQYEDTRIRVEELGTAARAELLQYATDRATIQEALALARRTRSTSSVELGRLLGVDAQRATALAAAGEPPGGAATPPLDQLYAVARDQNNNLKALEAQIGAARTRVEAAEDNDQVRLDLYATGSMGVAWARDDLPGLSLPGGRPAFGIIGGIELEVPMGPRVASAEAAQAREELRALEARFEAEVEATEAAVASLVIELDAAAQQVDLAQQTAELAAQLAEAERQRLELGTGTPADLVRARQSQRESELRHLRAVVSQATARYRLEHQVGGLLLRFSEAFREGSEPSVGEQPAGE